jgi:hypothetical protein
MRFFAWQSRATKQNEKRSGDDLGLSLPIPEIWGQVFGFGQNSDSREVVTPQSVMQGEGGRQVAFDNPLYRLLRDTPNDEQTGVDVFWELMAMWVCLQAGRVGWRRSVWM